MATQKASRMERKLTEDEEVKVALCSKIATETSLKLDNEDKGCGNNGLETMDIKVTKQIVEKFVSTIAKSQHQAVRHVDVKVLTKVVKGMKIALVTDSEQHDCVSVVYMKRASNSNYKKQDAAPANVNVLESKNIACSYNNNEASIKSCPSCKTCDNCLPYSRKQDLKMCENIASEPEPKKRKWQSIFGLFGG